MFTKKEKIYIGVLGLVVIAMVLLEYYAPKPVDWRRTYTKSDTIPYGNKILYSELEQLFGEDQVETNNVTTFELEESGDLYDYHNMIFIQENLSLTRLDMGALMNWVSEGNNVFIVASGIGGVLADTFNLELENTPVEFPFANDRDEKDDSEKSFDPNGLNFTNLKIKHPKYFEYKEGSLQSFFEEFDLAETEVLGMNREGDVNFLRMPVGDGFFYFNSSPLAFTNFNMLLKENHLYVSKALSYLPKGKILWDEYYKSGRVGPQSKLRFVLGKPALKWAWLLTVFSILFYIVFNYKRKQRIIPVVEPPKNTSLEFVETIGRLYYQTRDYNDLAGKKTIYFFEYLRQNHCPWSGEFTKESIERVAQKSGVPVKEVNKLFYLIEQIQQGNEVSESGLLTLSNQIENFKKKSVFA